VQLLIRDAMHSAGAFTECGECGGAALHQALADGLDDGFDPDDVDTGRGLHTMRDRADALGGSLEVESTPGEGTVVRLRVDVS
jgi:glucose-6-phosphate-specific signal transduction histidine kinase